MGTKGAFFFVSSTFAQNIPICTRVFEAITQVGFGQVSFYPERKGAIRQVLINTRSSISVITHGV
jgi:hypothetical protein